VSVRDRVGTLDGEPVSLARWTDEPYTRRYVDQSSERIDIPGDPGAILTDPEVRRWHIDDWTGGEGEDRWLNDGTYNTSGSVRPRPTGRGLVLGPKVTTTQDSTGAADETDIQVLGYARGDLWGCYQANAYRWNNSTERWGAAIATGASTNNVTSIAEADTTAKFDWIYVGLDNDTIRRFKPNGTNEEHYGTATGDDFNYPPVVAAYKSDLYALDGDVLYRIDTGTADTRTEVHDPTGRSDDFFDDTWPYNRMCVTDTGVAWFQRLDNGPIFIHHYNVETDTHEVISRMPNFVWPYDIYFDQGFIFVSYRYGPGYEEIGDGYIYFVRGNQRGSIGPLRDRDGLNSTPILFCGTYGSEIIFYHSSNVWAYSFATGGLYNLADRVVTGTQPKTAAFYGESGFVAGLGTTRKCDRWDLNEYDDDTFLSLETGLYHLGFPGVNKALLEVTVYTDPLPSTTSVEMWYRNDGDSNFTKLDNAHDTDDDTEFTWLVSDTDTSVTGFEFELSVELTTGTTTVTPVVRSITATSMAVDRNLEWFLNIDVHNPTGEGDDPSVSELIRRLVAVKDAGGVIKFTDTWFIDEYTAAEEFSVRIKDIRFPDVGAEGQQAVFIRLREAGAVAAGGGGG